MKKLIFLLLAFSVFVVPSHAQSVDASLSYSYFRLGGSGGINQNGVSGSVAYNPNRWLGVVGDFGGQTAIGDVGRYLSSHGTTVTAFYLSNVERYLFDRRRSWRTFYANVALLPYDDKSIFIRAILNRPASTLVSLLSPIADLMRAFEDGRIHEYQDVFC